MTESETDVTAHDVTADIRDLVPYLKAYQSALDKRKAAEADVKKWKEAETSIRNVITDYLDYEGANVGMVDGKYVCRYTKFTKPQFQKNKMLEAHPELASIVDEFTDQIPQMKFTPYNDQEKDTASSD